MVRSVFKSFLNLPKTTSNISILTPCYYRPNSISISHSYPVAKKIGSLFSAPVDKQFQEFGSLFSAKYSTNASNKGDGRVVTGIGGREYLFMSDEELMKQCELSTFKASGPGGQHRNKRESAVRLKHNPTGIIAQAVEDRSQHMNRASALSRLRALLALKGYKASKIGLVRMLASSGTIALHFHSRYQATDAGGFRLVVVFLKKGR